MCVTLQARHQEVLRPDHDEVECAPAKVRIVEVDVDAERRRTSGTLDVKPTAGDELRDRIIGALDPRPSRG
jgi:hypothetical protein